MHGLEGGLRIKGGIHAIEFTYQGAYQSAKATGTSSGGTSYSDILKLYIHSAGIGYQISEGIFGLGTDLQYQWYRFKFEDSQASAKLKNLQKMPAFKFYLMLNLNGGKGVDMCLQPYMVLPLKSYKLNPLSQLLNLESTHEENKWVRYGLSVLFYNGEN